MKRIVIRPGKTIAVSDAALARARGALKAFGLAETDLDRLAGFKGDVTIGPPTTRAKYTNLHARIGTPNKAVKSKPTGKPGRLKTA